VPSVLAYHRPTNLDEAAEHLSNAHHWALAGGTAVVPHARKQRSMDVEMVDLQALGLGTLEIDGDQLTLGAMVRLGDLEGDDRIPDLVKKAARRELPSALRNQATIGGTVAQADPESLLLAALLVHEARVQIHSQPETNLGEYLSGDRRGLVVGIVIDTSGRGSMASTGRTPADTPIVAALARSTNDGPRLALTGVAATPIEANPTAPTNDLDPPGDFRGSPAYRTHLAAVLSARALTEMD
jgi:probable selenate reductase FAD-binding subunit